MKSRSAHGGERLDGGLTVLGWMSEGNGFPVLYPRSPQALHSLSPAFQQTLEALDRGAEGWILLHTMVYHMVRVNHRRMIAAAKTIADDRE